MSSKIESSSKLCPGFAMEVFVVGPGMEVGAESVAALRINLNCLKF